MPDSAGHPDRAPTGINGLDYLLGGGLPRERIHLVHGGPGTGKTTMSFQFLLQGARAGERALYVTLLQTQAELEEIARSHGWNLEGVVLLQLPENVQEAAAAGQTVFSPAEIELDEATSAVLQGIEKYRPQRLVLDSVSELSVLVESPYQLQRQLLRLKRELTRHRCTTIFTVGDSRAENLADMQTLVHGVIGLHQEAPAYGRILRKLQITKMRGMAYVGGHHDLRIRTGGLDVFPRLRVDSTAQHLAWSTVASGNRELDLLLGGGLEEGTSCLVTGTTGVGKSTLCSLYVQAAAERGDRSLIYCFDERRETYLRRSTSLGLMISSYAEQGLIDLRNVHVGDLSPGEFIQAVRHAVDHEQVRIVAIDSLAGFMATMPSEGLLLTQLHELIAYLSMKGVLTLIVGTSHGVIGTGISEVNASYMADTVVLMRHFEAAGRMRCCISVLKKRHGTHERTIRELQINSGGIKLGMPLEQFTGVLTGAPQYVGEAGALMPKQKDA
jgi:circadian clock protein KaiC